MLKFSTYVEGNFESQNVADVTESKWMTHRLNITSPEILTLIVNLAKLKVERMSLDSVDLLENL